MIYTQDQKKKSSSQMARLPLKEHDYLFRIGYITFQAREI